MIIKSEVFKLSPGFDVDGVGHINGCVIRLLPRSTRETAQLSVTKAADERIRNAREEDEQELDAAVKYAVIMQTEGDVFFKLRIASFIVDGGKEITDRLTIDKYVALLTEPDEEEIRAQQEELQDAYRRPKFRPKHQYRCAKCGVRGEIECTREVSAKDSAPPPDVPRV